MRSMKKLLIEDKKAKSKSFFFKKESEVFDLSHVKFLEKFYKKEKKRCENLFTNSKKIKSS